MEHNENWINNLPVLIDYDEYMEKKKEVLEQIKIKAFQFDEKLNKIVGYQANDITTYLNRLIQSGRVEVGYRAACGTTDNTMKIYREWTKILKLLKKEFQIKEEPVKHKNGWATKGGGFWNSTIYSLEKKAA